MQYLRSKFFTALLVIWTIALGSLTPILMLIGAESKVRSYSRFWVRGIMLGLRTVVGLNYQIIGRFPSDGQPRLYVSNHQSAWETFAFAHLIPNVSFVAKKELRKVPIFGWYLAKYPMILIDRGAGKAALREMIEQGTRAVKEGRSILIFPEGTRIGVDDHRRYQFGVAALYKALNVPAIPIAHNAGCLWNDDYFMRYNGTVTVKILDEISPGITPAKFLARIEKEINYEKDKLASEEFLEEWRLALG
ncbi:lysophospholipid acyltransferase family protein [Roseibium aggregatum]|uniref:1-acyl-sn-glycerol-3-phosphate acyltransferase n=1 Tax=Roseibium aggregatum TaxID=187304 RepID=A0A926S741_9HYPH|nr:lysophospholipid acyltransferase family protein [Roseibium aggregatum]MBD1549233.1 1-acyl-sn-glycerol-3-phosphate acyltransferase [Roseibium aggregatum]